jgi:hypothetical protein
MNNPIREQKETWILVPIRVKYWADTEEVGCAEWTSLDECTRCLKDGGKFESKEDAWDNLTFYVE